MTAPVPAAARAIGDALRARGAARARVKWPDPKWRKRFAEFARDVLGKRTLARHQCDILREYYAKERVEIAVCTGQKLGKTEVLIIAILLDFASEPDLNGFIYGPKIEWIDEALWPRLAQTAAAAYYPCRTCRPAHDAWCELVEADPFDETARPPRCSNCSPLIGGDVKLDAERSEDGLRAADGRMVRGYTSRKLGGKGGLSGKVRFYCDESSDIPDDSRDAIAGNMSGGGKLLAFGNLLYRHGWFYKAFKSEKSRYTLTLQISSRRSPNCPYNTQWSDGVIAGNQHNERPVRGMADVEGIEANVKAWKGTDLIAARIDAIPPQIVEGQLAASESVTAAEARWNPKDDQAGILQFGVDVGRMRDPLAIAERRGRKVRDIYAEVLGEDDHARGVEILMGMVRTRRRPHERKPRVVFDETGHEGSRFGKELRRYVAVSTNPLDDVEIIGVQFGHPPRNRKLFDKRRDEIAHHAAMWLKTGAIPPDGELEAEIEATTAKRVEVSYGTSGMKWEVLRVLTNDDLRLIIGRSPNKFDALKLAVLDVDGAEEPAEDEPAPVNVAPEQGSSPTTPSGPVRVAPRPRPAPEPAEQTLSAFDQQDALYRGMWGVR